MRNFKKLLSLVLCMAVMLSVMVVGAGAAFSDQSKIKNTEAVDACSALNIINGYEDGSFKPEGNITRAEACKMICVALNGGKEPVLGTSATASFTDTKGHWAEGYIESCVAQGIVAGVGGGKFNPNGNVTGSQFAKMLLIALGYNAQHAQFLGNAWEVNVNVVATQKNLYEDLETMDVSAALTRDNAAQMVWNALQAIMVEYKYTLITDANGNLTSQITVEDKENYNYQQEQDNGDGWLSLLEAKYDATVVETIVNTVGHNTKGYTINGTYSKLAEDPTDFVGKAVKILCSDVDEVYGIYVDTDETMIDVTATVADLDKYTDGNNKFKVDGVEYTADGNDTAVDLISTIGDGFEKTAATDTALAVNYTLNEINRVASLASEITVIDNDGDEKVDVIRVTPVEVYKVNYVGADSITLVNAEGNNRGLTTIAPDKEDVVAYNGIAKGDYVSFVSSDYDAEGKNVLTKLDVVTGKVDGINTADDEVRVDGTWYKADYYTPSFTMGNTVSLVVLNGVIYAVPETMGVAATDYLVLTSNSNNEYGDVKAKAMLADGTEKIITISKVYTYTNKWEYKDATSVLNNSVLSAGTLCAYKVVDGEYQLIKIADAGNITADTSSKYAVEDTLGYDQVNNTASYANKKLGDNPVDSSALIFLHDKDGYKVVDGAHIQSWKNQTVSVFELLALTDANGGYHYVKVAYVNLGAATTDPGATSDAKYGYITSAVVDSSMSNGDSAVEFSLFNGEKTIVVKDKNNTSGLAKGDIVKYTEVEEGVIKVEAKTIAFSNTSNKYDTYAKEITALIGEGGVDTVLKFDSDTTEYVVTEDTVILYINAKDTAGVTGASVQLADQDSNSVFLGHHNALFAPATGTDDDGRTKLALLVVDINNNLDAQ